MNAKENKSTPSNREIKFEIPVEGSLGLLALGAVGLRAWRKVRKEHKDKQSNENENKKSNN